MKKLVKTLLALLLVTTLVACSSNGGEAAETTDGSKVIGFIGPLEGETSVYGIAVRNGAKLYVDEYNKANGTNYVLKDYDSKGDATEAVNAFNKLVDEDGAVAVLGGVLSGESTAIGSASQSTKTPVMSASATAADFTLTGSNVFRGCFTDPYQAKVLGEFTADTLAAKSAAIIYDTSSDYSKGMADNFTAAFQAKGGTILAAEGYNAGDQDFNTQLTKIAATNPDVLFIPNYYKDIALITTQARALGIEATFVGGDGWDGVLTVADAAVVEGSVFVNHYAPDDETVADWISNYKAVYNIEPNAFSVLGYDTMGVIISAIEQAGSSDADAITAKMQAISYDGVLGHLEFDENGDPVKDLGFITIKDGKYVSYGK